MTKSTSTEVLINFIEVSFPAFLRPIDLIKAGLFPSRSAISMAIKRNSAPPFLRLGERKIVFPRENLCLWLTKQMKAIDEELIRCSPNQKGKIP